MAHKSDSPVIRLTLARGQDGIIQVSPSQLLTYNQQIGFTTLRLSGGRLLEVKESTDEIDRLIRAAATNPVLALRVPASPLRKIDQPAAGSQID